VGSRCAAPRGVWLVAGGLSAELLLEGTFWRIVSALLLCPSSARISSKSEFSSINQDKNPDALSHESTVFVWTRLIPGFLLLSELSNAGLLPKCVRGTPRIINGLEIAANSHRASGRDSVSRWNTGMPANELAPPDHREFSLPASTDSLRDPQAAAPPDFSFLASAPSRFR